MQVCLNGSRGVNEAKSPPLALWLACLAGFIFEVLQEYRHMQSYSSTRDHNTLELFSTSTNALLFPTVIRAIFFRNEMEAVLSSGRLVSTHRTARKHITRKPHTYYKWESTKPALTLCVQARQQTSGKGRLKKRVKQINERRKSEDLYG